MASSLTQPDPAVDRRPIRRWRPVLWLLRSPLRRVLTRSTCSIRFAGRRTGRTIELPVEYRRTPGGIVVTAGNARAKTWWRNFIQPHPADVWLDDSWQRGVGRVVSRRPQVTVEFAFPASDEERATS